MDIERILDELAHYKALPREAMRAAAANREAVVPRFIEALDDYVAGKKRNKASDLLFLAFHLLGEWRERSAYRALVRFLRCDDVEYVLGDATTETSQRVMA